MVHVREIAARLANELVAASGRAASRSIQHLVVAQSGIELEHHVEVRVEAAGRHHDGFALDRDRLAGPGIAAFEARDAAALEAEPGDLRLGNDLAALAAEAFDQMGHQAETVALGPGPAQHRVALLHFQVGPASRRGLRPSDRDRAGCARCSSAPRRRRPTDLPTSIQSSKARSGVSWMPFCLLQRRADDQAAASGDDGRSAGLGVFLERDGARSGIPRLDAGRNAGGARANDRDVGLVLHDTLIRAGCALPLLR